MATAAEKQRQVNLDALAEQGWDETLLGELTDNQLAGMIDPDTLDELVDLANNALLEDPDEAEELLEYDDDDDELTDNMKSISDLSDNELMAEVAKRKKGKKKPTANKLTEDEWFQNAPESIQRLVVNARQAEDAEREDLLEIITANEANEFSEDELKGTQLDTLRRLAKMAMGSSRPAPTANNYGGRMTHNSLLGEGHEEAPLDLPDLGFGSDK